MFTLIVQRGYVLIVSDMEKRDFECPIRVLKKGEPIWNAFWGMEIPCKEPGLRGQEAAHWNCSRNCRRRLVWKYAMVAFLNQDPLGLVSVHWVEYPLQPWRFQILGCDICEMSILPWSYELAMCWYSPILQRRTSAKSDSSSTENTSGMCFKQRNLPTTCHCTEGKRKDIDVFAIMIGEFDMGKRPGWLPWAKRHWGWRPYTEVNEWSNHVACYLLISGVVLMAMLPCLYKLALCCFPCLCKHSTVKTNLPSPEKRICLKCFSGNANSMHQGEEGIFWFLCPNYRRILDVQKARVDFLSEVQMELLCAHGFDDTVDPGSFQTLDCAFVKWIYSPYLYELALCSLFLIWKRRNPPANAGFSSKEIQFAVPFKGWKQGSWHQCSES